MLRESKQSKVHISNAQLTPRNRDLWQSEQRRIGGTVELVLYGCDGVRYRAWNSPKMRTELISGR